MADSINPTGGKSKSSDFLPRIYRSDANKKFLQATVDQLVQPGTVKKINGYIGRLNAKATNGEDIFLSAPSKARQDYQLEPALVVKDTIGNTTFFKDYQDYINQISVFGGNVKNHARLNAQELYSWDPHICWDKFVNFQNYYWLPAGPDVITIVGQTESIESAYDVVIESQLDGSAYIFSPEGSLGLVRNPAITLYRGQTYKFNINSPGNPFSIKRLRTPGSLDRYQDLGISGYAIESGVLTFTVPYSSPDVLYYVSEFNADLGGVFEIKSIDENTRIDVATEILGKKTYTLLDGTDLSNGMKVTFAGHVTPEEYSSGYFYVEGVGSSITLVNEKTLELVSQYTVSEAVQFDSTPFDSMPFSDATAYAGLVDYIVINRASRDHNPWSRYNRWFHKDVIETSAAHNGKIASLDQNSRAVRPIIEFEPNLKLFNFGTTAISDVDLVDTFTTDVFSTIEGQLGYNVDGINLVEGHRVLFTADTDRLVQNNIYRVTFLVLDGIRQIHLVQEETPKINDVVLVKSGTENQGYMYWYDGSAWNVAQQKTTLNQSPLFDVVDSNGISYGDTSSYDGSSFTGSAIFTYKVGSGTVDSNLGFALSYKNISNIGDIVFNFNLLSDTFLYKEVNKVITQSTNVGFLVKSGIEYVEYVNGWKTSEVPVTQAAIRVYKNSNKTNNFEVDIYDDITDLEDLVVRVYVNGIRLESSNWSLSNGVKYKTVVLNDDITTTDVITIRSFAKQAINDNGYYEIPVNLQNNPLNDQITEFTLGEVIDHVNSIVDNVPGFVGTFPGPNNIRDLGNVSAYGTKFVQHAGPLGLALYHITSEDNNVIRAIEFARDEYNRFKRNFITIAEKLGVDADPVEMVDLILEKINKDKPKNHPFYLSDMVPYGAKLKTTLTVVDSRIKYYPLSNVFSLSELSTKAVGVYLNGSQLLHEHQYEFDNQGFVVILDSVNLKEDDEITIYEYDNTNGSFVPPTPTKLGIWPSYDPGIYVDNTYLTPRTMIQCHDGSLVLSYGDYRDDIILELEKRIYNNIKVSYNINVFDINDIIPGYNRDTPYSLDEFNEVLAPSFYSWTSLIDRDFTKPLSYDRSNSLTYNYRGHAAPDGRETPGYWRGIYRWMFDTDRPNLTPWEMLGFYDEPTWWVEVYGPAPYTSDNLPMWQDLSDGVVREPGKFPVVLEKYKRPFLINHIPVDDQGNIKSPYLAGLSQGIITSSTAGDFVFGDGSPIENAWRRSSFYPFSVLISAMILQPANTFGTLLDRSRIVKNIAGQLIYSETGLRITPSSVVLPSIYSSDSNIQTAGIINYIIDYILSDNLKSYNSYNYDLTNLTANLSYRVSGFTSKEKFNLLLDSRTPLSQGSVFVPQEDYDIILNSSSPIKKITYSGVIITKLSNGFEVKGYSKSQPYFKYYNWIETGIKINVGGISESYSTWTPYAQYAAGKIVRYNNKYYRSKVLHTTTGSFELDYYQTLAELPILGGRNAMIRTLWDRTEEVVVPYGTKMTTIQEVVDFLLGYGEWLKDQGFIFDEFNNTLNAVTNWETSAKEFLFWTTQNWSSGEDKWEEWLPNTLTLYGSIVRYNGDYYRAIRNSEPSSIFNEEDFVKLDGLSTVGSSVISVSPSAAKLTFKAPLSVVDDVRNQFYTYEIFKVDGTAIEPNFLNSYRDDNSVSYIPQDDTGIYGATFYLVQKEQVVILKNSTIFNDTIYNPTSGYRQERIKVSGYVNTDWNGSFNIPGFIFDQAAIEDWTSWKDYNLGCIVKYKEFYYSAKSFLAGVEKFNANDWIKLDKKPTAKMIPNWTYKASQFTDFYSLDSDNFDVDQQTVAQHLVGYQRRQYLSNIIQDNVSEFKFYQGMIVEKGTQNVLNKLFDVLSAEGQESLKFYEEWAIRVGQYGACRAFENVEFTLDESKFKSNPQGFELVDSIDPAVTDLIIRQTPNDIYLKPLGYTSNLIPVTESLPYLRTPGFVRANDAKAVLKTLDDIVDQDVSTFDEGDYVWVTFEGTSWNVYRYTTAHLNVTDVTYENNQLIIINDKNVSLEVGSYIGINRVTGFAGFYKIESVKLNKIYITASDLTVASPFAEQDKIVVFMLVSQRASNVVDESGEIIEYAIDRFDSVLPTTLKDNELVWIDDNGLGKWTTMTRNLVFSSVEITNPSPADNLQHGREIVLNQKGNMALVSNSLGEVNVFYKAGIRTDWIQTQVIPAPESLDPSLNSYTGDVLAISYDGRWMATGTPYAGIVSLYEKDSNNVFTLISTLENPDDESNSWFGSSITFGNDTMFVSAPRYNNNTGSVYSYKYSTEVQASTSFNPTDSIGTTIKVLSTTGISVGMTVVGVGFSSNQVVESVVDSSTLILNKAPDSEPTGVLQFTTTAWRYVGKLSAPGTNDSSYFGSKLSISGDNSLLAATGIVSGANTVFLYNTANRSLTSSSITSFENSFAQDVAVSYDGSYVAVSIKSYDGEHADQGKVVVYKKSGSIYSVYQTIVSRSPETAQEFGSKIYFMGQVDSLVVFSSNADNYDVLTFTDNTTFDNLATRFVSAHPDSGRVDVYDRYFTKWIYSESLAGSSDKVDFLGDGIAVSDNQILISASFENDQDYRSGKVYSYTRPTNKYTWSTLYQESEKPDIAKVKRAFLYNKLSNKLVSYIDVIDPMQGKIPGIADQEIKYKTFYDPAIYSIGNSTVNVDDGMAWAASQVGTLWWNLSTVKFIDSYDTDVVYRNSVWNTLAVGASIDVCEWVETEYLPVDWDELADTEEGLALNISGLSLYGNDAYSVVRRYDTVSKTFKNKYYYWVKNKKTIPNVPNRYMAAQDVADMISNPRGEGYKYLALTSTNSFSLVNVSQLLEDTSVVLSLEYWTTDSEMQNIHSQWKVISNDELSEIPQDIELKWFDSLCGKDLNDRPVPDYSLPVKLRYGVENRPRQGMFVNRFEALKQLIEQVNRLLIKNLISTQRNISALEMFDPQPSEISGKYDTVIDTDSELRFVTPTPFVQAVVEPVIVNGRIIDINIVEKGKGYLNNSYIEVAGSGTGAKLKTVINSKGQVTGAEIINSGVGYDDNTVLVVRNYCVLVKSDSAASGNWSIYSYDSLTRTWSRVESQSYDVRNYWSYVDWYASGYNQFTAVDYAIDTFADLNTIEPEVGQLVKIRTSQSNTWILLEKYADASLIDWTQSYKVVGSQNGTIQLSSGLYQFNDSAYGFDGSLYDGAIFDNAASSELRIILDCIKNDILTDDLKPAYLDLFFSSVRYALSEQTYLDWIFKTSFVKAQHNVGKLKQKVTYNNDNLANFEDYVSEVKPYRTKVREYVSSYSSLDNTETIVTDFDLPSVYTDNKLESVSVNIVNGIPVSNNRAILEFPWKHWLDNVGFSIIELKLFDGGSGYISEPVVRIESNTGSGATARAFISNGRVNRVVLLTQGSGYLSAPTVILDGGLGDGGTAARVVPIIGNSVIRSNLIKLKYDRITQSYTLTQLQETETFSGDTIVSGSRLQFPLKWAPDVVNTYVNNIRNGNPTVLINDIEVLKSDYKLDIVKSTSRGYTSYSGTLTFDTAPALGSTIIVNYTKDWSLLNAADRVQHYYNPAAGNPGKELAQLMAGIDYGGVIVNGMGFDNGFGWNNAPYFTDKWDSLSSTFDDYIVTVAEGTHSFVLPYTPEEGTEINVYHSKFNVDSYTLDGIETSFKYNVNDIKPIVTAVVSTTAPTSSVNVAGSSVLRVASTAGVVIGDVVTTYYAIGNISETSSVGNKIILSSSTGLNLNEKIVIKGASIGNLTAGTYYVKSIIDETSITISATVDGVVLVQTTASGSMAFSAHNVFAYGTTVTEILSETDVRLDQILYSDIGSNSAVTFTRDLVVPVDCVIYTNGVVELTDPLTSGTELKISSLLDPERIDGTGAAMETWIADGVSRSINIPDSVEVNTGDQFILRKSTSDGSIAPQESDYDTALSGGNLAYSTATGLAADDIIVDGDGFVTPTTSSAPEEVVPGQVVDAVAIKVFDRQYSASAIIKVDTYAGDAETTEFAISQTPNSSQALIVKFTTGSRNEETTELELTSEIKALGVDYTVDYAKKTITFIDAPLVGTTISIFSFGFNGENVLDIDYFVATGNVNEFVTKAPWTDTISSLVYVDGVVPETNAVELFKTDSSYETTNCVGIRFDTSPAAGSLINYVIVDSETQTFSVTKTERFEATGSNLYNLSYVAGVSEPVETSMIVRVDQTILNAPNNSYFTIKGNTANYSIDQTKHLPYSVTVEDIVVIADGDQLVSGVDYSVSLSGITVKLNQRIRREYAGKTLIISIKTDQGYIYIPPSGVSPAKIQLSQTYDAPSTIEVISSYNHDVLDIQRTAVNIISSTTLTPDTVKYYNYKNIAGGYIELDRAVLNDRYVWLMKNGQLLTPSIDYKLNEDKRSVQLSITPSVSDKITIMTYSSNTLTSGIAYMQFKDMLNRVHFKRLSLNKQARLVNELRWNDLTIEVDDASNFDTPNASINRPGIVEICGERIEYFTKVGNVLGQLRRGTLGTGTRPIYRTGTFVQDIGSSETMPYAETNIVENVISDGTTVVPLRFVPANVNEIEVFAAGRRLKKHAYSVYNPQLHPESPEGDESFDAEFTVDGTSNNVTLRDAPVFGTQVTLVKRVGTDWDGKETSSILYDDNKVARFVKATPGIWYTEYKKDTIISSFDSTSVTFDNTNTTFDQG